jgi:Fe-S-cluster containining protein
MSGESAFQDPLMKIDIAATGRLLDVSIGVDARRSFSCVLSPPDGDVTFVDVLPEIYEIYSNILGVNFEESEQNGKPVRCGKGCVSCCHQLITVSVHEALLLAHIVGLLGQEEQQRIRSAFDESLSRLEEAGLLRDLLHSHVNAFENRELVKDTQRRYWALGLACPFLLDGTCAIYPYRPFICRQYCVSSDPEHCGKVFEKDHLIERIRLSHDFGSAAASFDGLEAIKTRTIPLPAIFLVHGILHCFERPKATAEVVIARFLRHVDKHFSR